MKIVTVDMQRDFVTSNEKIELDHIDIVTTHMCNNNCKHCIDKFVKTSNTIIANEIVDKFLKMIREYTTKPLEVLLLGGEPTTLPVKRMIEIADIIHSYGFSAMMSTNGILTKRIVEVLPYFDSVQITILPEDDEKINFWKQYADKINMKVAMDGSMTMERMQKFIEKTKDFARQSVCMYFTPDFQELCTDKDVWALLDTLDWKRNGSYTYAFKDGVRYKKCVPGETNIVDEPTVPKVYPNGNYNKTWNHEELDDYLCGDWNER